MNKWQEWKSNNPAKPWDIINPSIKKLDKEKSQKRLDICLSCDKLIKSTKQCKECGCFMQLKTQLPHASCPLGKWGEIVD